MQISTITTLSLLLTPCITSPLQRSSAIRWTPHDWLDRNRGLWQFDSSCIVFKSLANVVENLVTLGPSWNFHWSLNGEKAKNSHVRPLTGRTEKTKFAEDFHVFHWETKTHFCRPIFNNIFITEQRGTPPPPFKGGVVVENFTGKRTDSVTMFLAPFL